MRIPSRTLNKLAWSYSVLLILIFLINLSGPEKYIPTFVNMYIPQSYWAVPPAALLIATIYLEDSRILPVVHCSLMLIFVVSVLMDFRLAGSISNQNSSLTPLRLMTYNVNGGKNTTALMQIIRTENPSIILFQESSPDFFRDFRKSFPAWNIIANDDLMIASAYEITDFERVDLPKLSSDKWKRPAYVRAVVNSGVSRFSVYNVHLSTPREAINSVRRLGNPPNFHWVEK